MHMSWFTAIISYSSIEHDGLGRYGDPINPGGDVAAMREFWRWIRPGGLLYLGVPRALMKDVYQNFYPACLHHLRCPGIFVVEYSLRARISGHRLISTGEMCKPLTWRAMQHF